MIKVFVMNQYLYTCGDLEGEELTLPMPKEELKSALKRILKGKGEEVFISEYEDNRYAFSQIIDNYQYNVELLNDLLLSVSSDELETLCYIMQSDIGLDLNDSINILNEERYLILDDVEDDETLGYELIKNDIIDTTYLKKIPDHYIDHEMVALDYSTSNDVSIIRKIKKAIIVY